MEATANGPKSSSTPSGKISDITDIGLLEINDKTRRTASQEKEKVAQKSKADTKSRRNAGKISRYTQSKENNVKRHQRDPVGTSRNPSKKNSTDHPGIPQKSARNGQPNPIGTTRSITNDHPDPIGTPRNMVRDNQVDHPHLTDLTDTSGSSSKNNQVNSSGASHNRGMNNQPDHGGTSIDASKVNHDDPTDVPSNKAIESNRSPNATRTPDNAARNKQPDPISMPQRATKKNQPDPVGTPRRMNHNEGKKNRPSHQREKTKKHSPSENFVGVEDATDSIGKNEISNHVSIPTNNNKIHELSALQEPALESTFEESSPHETSFDQPSMEGEGDGKQGSDGSARGDSEVHPLLLNQPITQEEKELEAKCIFKLHKKKLKFPKAKYFCRLCNYHMDTLKDCEDHASQTRHIRLMKNKLATENFQELPKLSPSHLDALTATLEDVVRDVGLTEEMMDERQKVAERVNSVIKRVKPDCQVDMYGSSVSGFGFKTSGINLNIRVMGTVKMTAAELLLAALEILTVNKKHFKNVEAKFEEKFPVISFIDKASKLNCDLGTGSEFAVSTSCVLRGYMVIEPRVRTLGIAFRYWARLLEIDKPWDGGLPAYVYALMVIFFLQRCLPPVLPVMQEGEKLTEENQQSIGELWIKLFHFYLVQINIEEEIVCIRKRPLLSRKEFHLPNRRIVVDDPCAEDKKSLTKYVSSAEIFSFIMDGFHIGLEYFSSSNGLRKKDPENKSLKSKQRVESSSSSDDRSNSGEDSAPVKESTQVEGISVDTNEGSILESDSHPGDSVREVSPTLNDIQVDCITDTNSAITDEIAAPSDDQTDSKAIGNTALTNDNCSLIGGLVHNVEGEVKASTQNDVIKENEVGASNCGIEVDEEDGVGLSKLNFVFDKDKLTGGHSVPKICSNCQQEGHLSQDCEDDKLPELVVLPPMEGQYLEKIQQLCNYVSDQFSPTKYEMQERNYIIRELENFIRRWSGAPIKLALFGSSVNGFGFQNSDLDICMTFDGNPTGEHIDVRDVIQSLAHILKNHHGLYNVIPITTAKVPIVKFLHRSSALEGDISLYNLLAQHNTRLLKTYSDIDRRVSRLGHMVKAFAKECDIADASRGSLSSYAYILLTLYFLQQTTPPVIPVLQELHEAGKKPERLVEGRNVWYFQNITKLRNVWKGFGHNRLSEAQLWLDFLRFYTEKFDFTKYVVCIRQYKKLTRFEKMWMGKGFAIEDPFDLDHNLGGALSRRMANYITLVFRKGREKFGTPQSVPRQYIYEFFLDYDYLTDGQLPPNDRGCRICGKIGHFVKDCPVKLRSKERKRAKATAGQKNVSQDPTETTNSQGPATNSRTQSTPNNPPQDSHVSGGTKSTKESVNKPHSQSQQRTVQSNAASSNAKAGNSKERERKKTNDGEDTIRAEESGQPKSPLATQTPSTDEMSPPRSAMTPTESIMTPSQPVMAPQQQPAISPSRLAMTPPSPLSPSVMSGLQGSPNSYAGSPPLPLLQFGMGSPTRTSSPGPMSPIVYSPLAVPGSPFSGTIMYPRSPVPFVSQPYQMPLKPPPGFNMVQSPRSYQPFPASAPPVGPIPLMSPRTPMNLQNVRTPVLAQATAELQQLLGVLPPSLTNPQQQQPNMETSVGATPLQEGPS